MILATVTALSRRHGKRRRKCETREVNRDYLIPGLGGTFTINSYDVFGMTGGKRPVNLLPDIENSLQGNVCFVQVFL